MGRCFKLTPLFLLVALCLPAYGSAATFYVSPDGVDTRPCDLPGAPCKTISRALERARNLPGAHTIRIAARHDGERAVYRETVQVTRGAGHEPKLILDGSWQGGEGHRALIAPRGKGGQQVVRLASAGAEIHNLDIDATEASGLVAGLVLDNPGSEHRVRAVKVTVSAGQVGVVVNSPSARLRLLESVGAGLPALDYSALGEPVVVEDSLIRQTGNATAIRGSGLSSLIFRRSIAFAPAQAPRVIGTEGGQLFLDSSLVSGGKDGAIHLGGATGPSLRAVSSTIDSGAPGIADPELAAVTLAPGGNAEVDIIGSILLEPPLITVAGGATIRCSYSDVPSTVVVKESPPQVISCGAGVDGNAHHPPEVLFAGTAPFTGVESYRLRAGSPAINTGPNPAPPDATAFDLFGEPRIQPPGTCAEEENVIDKGALEFGCTPSKDSPRPPGLFGDRAHPVLGDVAGRAVSSAVRPVIRRARAVNRRVAPGYRVRIVFTVNRAARVVGSVVGTKLRRVKKARRGRNVIVIPTRALKVRKDPYKVVLTARAGGKVSVPRRVAFRLVSPLG